MKKSIIVISLMIILALMLTACTSGNSPRQEDENPGEEIVQIGENKPDDRDNIDDTGEKFDKNENIEPVGQSDDVEIVVDGRPKNPLTGLPYHGEYKPVAMVIENSPAARPQSGLIYADLVYEAHAEGGITRFLAIFLSERPEIVGPIRSLRHYFMHMAREWDAYLIHYGQSFIAEAQFNTIQVRRLNGLVMPNEKPFWRDKSRKAPHNVYIDSKDCLERIDFEQKEREFEFSTEPLPGGKEYSSLILPFNKSSSLVEYRYDKEKGVNMRYMNGKPHLDRETGEQLYNKNIIVQYAKHGILEPGAGYREVEVIGSGKAVYFIDGKYQEGIWERKGPNAATQYLDSTGQPIRLSPGKVWIEVVPTDMKITIE